MKNKANHDFLGARPFLDEFHQVQLFTNAKFCLFSFVRTNVDEERARDFERRKLTRDLNLARLPSHRDTKITYHHQRSSQFRGPILAVLYYYFYLSFSEFIY